MDEYERLRNAYEAAQMFCLLQELTTGAEAAGRLENSWLGKEQEDLRILVQSVAVAKRGYTEFQSFGLESEDIRARLAALELKVKELAK